MMELLTCLAARTAMANNKNFNKLLQKNTYSLVLFERSRSPACKKVLDIMDKITDEYSKKVSMIMIDVEEEEEIAKQYSIINVPSISLFSKNGFVQHFNGDLSEETIRKFCDNIGRSIFIELKTAFDIFEFQKTTNPGNLLIVNTTETQSKLPDISELSTSFAGTIPIGLVKNSSLASILNLSIVEICHPHENTIIKYNAFDFHSILRDSSHFINLIHKKEDLGGSFTTFSLITLLDERDPLHWLQVSNLFKAVQHKYSDLSFQAADFYMFPEIIHNFAITNFKNPLYFLIDSRHTKGRPNLFHSTLPSKQDMIEWLDEAIKGIKPKREKFHNGIPVIYANDFQNTALNPRVDAIFLFGDPMMPTFANCEKKFKQIMRLFKQFHEIQFYEFNPLTQIVPGLMIDIENSPMISIWPAQEYSGGSSFSADIPIQIIIENIVKLIKTKLTQSQLQQLAETVKKLD